MKTRHDETDGPNAALHVPQTKKPRRSKSVEEQTITSVAQSTCTCAVFVPSSPDVLPVSNPLDVLPEGEREKAPLFNADKFPKTVLVNIFKYLSLHDLNECAVSCRRFYELLSACPQWKHHTVTNPSCLTRVKHLGRLSNLRSLTFVSRDGTTGASIPANLCSKLTSVRFFFARRTSCTALSRQIANMSALTCISFTGIVCSSVHFSSLSLQTFNTNNTNNNNNNIINININNNNNFFFFSLSSYCYCCLELL